MSSIRGMSRNEAGFLNRSEEDYDVALARVLELMTVLSPPEGEEDEGHPTKVESDVLA